MRLMLINHEYALFDGKGTRVDACLTDVLNRMLRIKTWRDLLGFLKDESCNQMFVTSIQDPKDPFRQRRGLSRRTGLQGSLERAISRDLEVDLLDDLALRDEKRRIGGAVDVWEVLELRETLTRYLTAAAVALGAPSPKDFFFPLEPGSFFSDESVPCRLLEDGTGVSAVGFIDEMIGCIHHGILEEENLDWSEGVYMVDLESGRTKELPPSTKSPPLYDDARFALICIERNEYCIDGENGEYVTAAAFTDEIDPKMAQMILVGKALEALLGPIDFTYQHQFVVPQFDTPYPEYEYIAGRGFTEIRYPDREWWVELLLDHAQQQVIRGMVSLCPVCGTPFVLKKNTSRNRKRYCSDSCKTRACRERSENDASDLDEMKASNLPS